MQLLNLLELIMRESSKRTPSERVDSVSAQVLRHYELMGIDLEKRRKDRSIRVMTREEFYKKRADN